MSQEQILDTILLIRKEGDIKWKRNNKTKKNVEMNTMFLINFKRQVVTLLKFLMFKIKNLLQLVVDVVVIPNYIVQKHQMVGMF